MENREEQILSEIRASLVSLRVQFEELESRISELSSIYGGGEGFDAPIDLDLDDDHLHEEEVTSSVPETVVVQEVFADSIPDDLPEDEPRHELNTDAIVPETVHHVPESVHEVSEEKPIYEKAQSDSRLHKAVIDVMAEKQAWRTDLPGTPVKDIRSAISLNDRIIFINLLFGEDPMAFQQALTHINALETLGQAVEYITSEFPHWDMDSDLVYRFMMAVRRKVK